MVYSLVSGAVPAFEKFGFFHFISSVEWDPRPGNEQYGALAFITGTIMTSFLALVFCIPFSLPVALFTGEYFRGRRIAKVIGTVIDLLAGIPSVVYGFFGLVAVVPLVRDVFDLPVGETALAGSLILAIMALPTIITVAEDTIRTTPRAMRESSLALGATHWQTIRRVVLPYSASGIAAAAVLGIGCAVGETMAVLMVTGNAAVIPTTILEPLRTIPATIAAELGEAPAGGPHYQALFLLGVVLFFITLIINFSVEYISSKGVKRSK